MKIGLNTIPGCFLLHVRMWANCLCVWAIYLSEMEANQLFFLLLLIQQVLKISSFFAVVSKPVDVSDISLVFRTLEFLKHFCKILIVLEDVLWWLNAIISQKMNTGLSESDDFT